MDDHNQPEPIAIVGMACRLPGEIVSPSKLWDLLVQERSAQSDIPHNRFNVNAWYHPEKLRPGSINTRGGFFLSGDESFRQFDASFFGINPKEAASMDPQQRKLLEVVYESFEAAGARLEDISGSNTACYVGNFTWDIGQMQARDMNHGAPYHMTGGGLTILSNRVNYVFNLKGPSMTVDTACSSTMYALHMTCRSIQAGDCSAAVVAGTNLIFGVEQQIASVRLGVLSPTSVCHTFDESADGYARAEAVGALYLKPLSQAIANKDPIRAVIRGTSINANGRSSGISRPNATDQELVIRQAYATARLGFEQTGYFECHGTGTPVGDPLEVSAIGNVFGNVRTPESPLLLGSVKTNLGHGGGLELVERYDVVRSVLNELEETLAGLPSAPNWSLLQALAQPKEKSRMNEAEFSQALTTAIQIAIVDLLKSWGVIPTAVVGHSSGEIAAAYCAGHITAKEAIIIAYQRGTATVKSKQRGAMLAVGLSPVDVIEIIQNISDIGIACYNAPDSVTLTGSEEAVDDARTIFSIAGIFHRKLATSGHAYHSSFMEEAGGHYEAFLKRSLPGGLKGSSDVKIAMFSSVTDPL